MRRGPLTGTVSLLSCLNHFSSASSTKLSSGFRNCFILIACPSNTLIILAVVCQIVWIVEFTRPNSRHTSGFCLPFSIFHINLTFPLTLKILYFLFLAVSMLLRYQSSVNP